MSDPVLHIVAGPNGAGKTTFINRVLAPIPLEFVNADNIAADNWPGDELSHGYAAAELAAQRRAVLLEQRRSFATETVFSHESKVDLIRRAVGAGYLVSLHVILIPEDLAVARVESRVKTGGHEVPEEKVRSRHRRLWTYIREAVALVAEAHVFDNTSASSPFRLLATFRTGVLINEPNWPVWTPPEFTADMVADRETDLDLEMVVEIIRAERDSR